MITVNPLRTGQGAICEPILRALPSWFGIEEATRHYITYTDENPTFVAYNETHPVGFLALHEHTTHAAEIYVMGVLPSHHRGGVGRALLLAAEADLRERGFKFLQVKTISDSHPDEGYKKTRAFYRGMGFYDLEVFPELLGEHNPALQLVKAL